VVVSSFNAANVTSSSASLTVAAGALLTIARDNGTSTFGVNGNTFTRASDMELYDTDGLIRYSWTAGATATVTLVFDYRDENFDGSSYQIRRTRSGSVTEITGTSADAITRTVSVIAGDVITFSSNGSVGSQYFANVSVSAA
jgi:hypothetical protein